MAEIIPALFQHPCCPLNMKEKTLASHFGNDVFILDNDFLK